MNRLPYDIFPTPDCEEVDIEAIYSRFLTTVTGGVNVMSLKAPPLSTEFVKSRHSEKARPGMDGALLEVKFPSRDDIRGRQIKLHGHPNTFGYAPTEEADSYHAGYGEKTAMSVQKEDSTYQLKSSFTTAAMAFGHLKARVTARGGDGGALTEVFARMWGLSTEQASLVPSYDIAGSEATRLAAMEDRAYHSLTCHPAYAGGYRVDMASISTEGFGPDIPINWQRLRTGAKAIAQLQLQGDIEVRQIRQRQPEDSQLRLTLDITLHSQPRYRRTFAWETVWRKAMQLGLIGNSNDGFSHVEIDMSSQMSRQLQEIRIDEMSRLASAEFTLNWKSIAAMIKDRASKVVEKSAKLLEIHREGRALLGDEEELEVEEIRESIMGKTYQVPPYRVSKDRITTVMTREFLGRSNLPDVVSHGRGRERFDHSSIRNAGMDRELKLSTALNFAVFISTMRKSSANAAYTLMKEVKDPNPGGHGRTSVRLRNKDLYYNEEVWKAGKFLFDDAFVSTLESIIRNMVSTEYHSQGTIVTELWSYLRGRTGRPLPCPIHGTLVDLIEYLREAPEGWTMYYWARVSIGKWQYASQNGILAPILTGKEVDLISAFKSGIRERAQHWASFYTAEYHDLFRKFSESRGEEDEDSDEASNTRTPRYIPPHRRDRINRKVNLDADSLDEDNDKQKQYARLAEVQVKKKFFKNVQIKSHDRFVSVGLSDDMMTALFIESYVIRWRSIDRRMKKAKKKGKVFRLGRVALREHPWGELLTDFPDDLDAVRDLLRNLNPIGWTINPDLLWEKLQKSINELWQDIGKELDTTISLIEESGMDSVDDQAYSNLTQYLGEGYRPKNEAYVLPAFGYTPPYVLPKKNITVVKEGQDYEVSYHAGTTTTSTNINQSGEVDDDDGGWSEGEEGEILTLSSSRPEVYAPPFSTLYSLEDASYREEHTLTYREIWSYLGLGDVEDQVMRIAFPVIDNKSLDDEHKDNLLGPVVLAHERDRTHKMWASRIEGIAMRAGMKLMKSHSDDM